MVVLLYVLVDEVGSYAGVLGRRVYGCGVREDISVMSHKYRFMPVTYVRS